MMEWLGWIAFGALAIVVVGVFCYVVYRLVMNPFIS